MNLRELDLGGNRLKDLDEECFIQLENLVVLDISKNLLKVFLTEETSQNHRETSI